MTQFLRNYFHTERDAVRRALYTTVRAGHLVADKSHAIERETLAGHELIYCVKGSGLARINGRVHRLKPHGLLWVSCWHPHRYEADPARPWELYWARIDGPGLDALADLLRIRDQPVFADLPHEIVSSCYEEMFQSLESPGPTVPARMHEAIARMLGFLYENRFQDGASDAESIPNHLEKPLLRMRQHYADPLRLAELSVLAGMSVSHFVRTFKRSMGTSPIDWLRHERINQAKRRLIDTPEPIKEIARQCGYRDPYFFSKDFKKITGLPPTAWRAQEAG
jgi:AraC-like DNA-binding protein